MKQTLNAKEMPLYKVFSDDYLFTIPAVQRPYSWTTEEAGDLLNDLVDYINRNNITEDNIDTINEPYFLGSLVLVNTYKNKYEVLDGQQRLTTLTILLATLRDYLSNDYGKFIKVMIRQEGNKLIQTKDENRIELRKRDQDFFQQYIQTDKGTLQLNKSLVGKTDSQNIIRDNALYFTDQINMLDPNIVRALPGVIASLCYMVIVSTYNFDSAFRIFTVLNDRGLDLLESDIFKARAIGDVPQSEQEEYTKKWEEVEVALGRDRFNKLFDHIRMIIQKRKGSSNLKDEFEKIFETMDGKHFINDVLLPYSEIYINLIDFHTQYRGNPEMIKLLSLMNRIENSDWIPPAMFYIHKDNTHTQQFLERLEALAATAMILRRNFNWRMSKYAAILKEIDSGLNVFSNNSSLAIPLEDRRNIIELLNGDVYLELKDSVRRYILLRLDSLLSSGQPFYDQKIITVEHILPQNPERNSTWSTSFSNPEKYVHKLGNLVLLTRRKNAQASNFEFPRKKSSYFQSSKGVSTFAITSQVIQEDEWTPSIIEKRQQKLINLLVKTWNLK
ncbi:hypothetical protein CSV74_12760 [Sporosarcina sp. P19]|uniref:DUF262 domain-containing protein n=1 Tax=Sporosarcina sp. P19 TaxID=2048258 RepID=UPI000C167294|nr:DUF262 domain-containing protein [Sporosarcina sp. P19]PIC76136.1 hypothetical protein CSV74_12760 [Sporosarcina sp. P19]